MGRKESRGNMVVMFMRHWYTSERHWISESIPILAIFVNEHFVFCRVESSKTLIAKRFPLTGSWNSGNKLNLHQLGSIRIILYSRFTLLEFACKKRVIVTKYIVI